MGVSENLRLYLPRFCFYSEFEVSEHKRPILYENYGFSDSLIMKFHALFSSEEIDDNEAKRGVFVAPNNFYSENFKEFLVTDLNAWPGPNCLGALIKNLHSQDHETCSVVCAAKSQNSGHEQLLYFWEKVLQSTLLKGEF